MAANTIVDAGFLIALLNRRDLHHDWAIVEAKKHRRPWRTCEAALSEAFHLVESSGVPVLSALLQRQAVTVGFDLSDHLDAVLKLLAKYADVPASLADACLVRMTEIVDDPMLLTTDADFGLYRRHGRQAIPNVRPR